MCSFQPRGVSSHNGANELNGHTGTIYNTITLKVVQKHACWSWLFMSESHVTVDTYTDLITLLLAVTRCHLRVCMLVDWAGMSRTDTQWFWTGTDDKINYRGIVRLKCTILKLSINLCHVHCILIQEFAQSTTSYCKTAGKNWPSHMVQYSTLLLFPV